MSETHKFNPDWVISPGACLQEQLDYRNLSPRVFAVACGVDAEVIRGILTAKRRVTRKIAERFADVLGMSPQFWLNYEKIYRDGLKAGKKECS